MEFIARDSVRPSSPPPFVGAVASVIVAVSLSGCGRKGPVNPPVLTLKHAGVVASIGICPKSGLIAAGSAGRDRETGDRWLGDLRVWNPRGELVFSKRYQKWVRCLQFTPDGSHLILAVGTVVSHACRYDAQICHLVVLSVPDFTEQKSLRLPAMIVGMDISADGKSLATIEPEGASHSRIRLWRLPGLAAADSFKLDGAVIVASAGGGEGVFPHRPIAFSPRGDLLAVCTIDEKERSSTVTLRDVGAKENKAEYLAAPNSQYEKYALTFVMFDPASTRVTALGRYSPTVELAIPTLEPSKCSASIGGDNGLYLGGHKIVFTTSSREPIHCVMDDLFTHRTFSFSARGSRRATSYAVSPDGPFIAAGDDAGHVYVWNTLNATPK